MHICFFIGGLSGGGAERVTCNLANYMVERDHDVEILTMADDAPSYELSQKVTRKVLLRTEERKSFIFNSILRLVRFWKYLRRTEVDVIVVMLPITTILLLQMRRMTKAAVIAAERSLPSIYKSKEQHRLKKLARRADGWVFQTDAQKAWYEKAGIRKGVIIPNAINPEFIRPLYAGERRNEIVTVGSLTVPKNQELLINAFAQIAKDWPAYRLVLYGKGPKLELLQTLAETLGISERVVFAGYSTNVYESIKAAKLFVLSSDYEGMPNALMEAMATGLPCVSTDCDGAGARGLIEDGKNGLLVPKGDVESLTSAMNRMLTDREFAEKCGQEAHKICERLAPEKVYSEWEGFITEIVNSK